MELRKIVFLFWKKYNPEARKEECVCVFIQTILHIRSWCTAVVSTEQDIVDLYNAVIAPIKRTNLCTRVLCQSGHDLVGMENVDIVSTSCIEERTCADEKGNFHRPIIWLKDVICLVWWRLCGRGTKKECFLEGRIAKCRCSRITDKNVWWPRKNQSGYLPLQARGPAEIKGLNWGYEKSL